MSETLLVQLNSDRVQAEPGGAPVELVVTLQNLGDVIDQYTVELTGLDPEWFTMPNGTVGLFPQDRDEVRVSLHPPKRPGSRAGAYPFRVVVRSRAGTQHEAVEGTLQVRGYAVYRLDLTPRHQTARRSGHFKVLLANTGNADVRLALEARDTEGACELTFPRDDRPLVPAGAKTELPLVVRPRRRPWIGPEQRYDFVVTARPHDAGGDPQTVPGQFTQRPWFESWAPLRRLLAWTAVGVLVLLVGIIIFPMLGLGHWQQTLGSAVASARGLTCDRPIVGAACPNDGGGCTYEFGFEEFFEAEPKLVDACSSPVTYDRFGNGTQYTQTGLLVWQKQSNTVYLFRGDSLWAYIQGHTDLLYGSGRF